MYVQYGDYKHASGEVELDVSVETQFLESQIPFAERHRWTLSGMLVGTGQNDIDSKVAALQLAYASTGRKDAVLYKTNGSPTRLKLLDDGSIDGVRVITPPTFPSNRGGAYSTYLPYRIVLEAEYPVADADAVTLVSFRETIQRTGGGPLKVVLETLETPAVYQVGKLFPAYRATQSGEAVGLYQYPFVPPPLWPASMIRPVQTTQGSPQRRGRVWINYPISWSYEFASNYPLFGGPNVAGLTY